MFLEMKLGGIRWRDVSWVGHRSERGQTGKQTGKEMAQRTGWDPAKDHGRKDLSCTGWSDRSHGCDKCQLSSANTGDIY